jgi:hypothetical protein
MILERNPSPSASIIAAAIVAIAGSVLTILIISLTIFSLLVVGSRVDAQLPSAVRTNAFVSLLTLVGLSIYGVVTGVGLFRLKNWARYSVLVWGGVMVFFGAIGIIAVSFVSLPTRPNMPANAIMIMRWGIVSVYGLPLLVGVWWLALFNRTPIKRQFTGDPVADDPSVPAKLRGPLPITVLGWFFVVSLATSIPWLLWWRGRTPVFVFGYLVPGLAGKAILLLSLLLTGLTGYGLIKLKPWGYVLAICSQCFWFASGLMSALNPHARAALTASVRELNSSMQLPASVSQPDITTFMPFGLSIGIAFAGAILCLLLYYRKRFLDAAAQSPS